MNHGPDDATAGVRDPARERAPVSNRDAWLSCDDAVLLAQCDVDTYRASGPGGQKRNKTSTAVRLRHRPSGQMVIAEESRSQHENKARALRRLRMAIALDVRCAVEDDARRTLPIPGVNDPAAILTVSPRRREYAIVVAAVLDIIAARTGQLRAAAAVLGVTTAPLTKFITRDGKVLDRVNRIRRAAGHAPLRSD